MAAARQTNKLRRDIPFAEVALRMGGVVAERNEGPVAGEECHHLEQRIDYPFRRRQRFFDARGAVLVALAFRFFD